MKDAEAGSKFRNLKSPIRDWAAALFILILSFTSRAQAEINYIYDESSRLTGVIDPAGETAVYNYDAVGNLLSITRQSSAAVSIIEFTPNSGPVGTTVTIYGTGFSTTAGQNAVTFNGTAATITSATATQIVTSVPTGATTGPIAITTPTGSATSSISFTVTTSIGAPTITGFTPTVGTPGTAVTITGTNFETTPSNNRVTFNNNSRPLVSSSTATTIGTSVPSGATSGRIAVATQAGKAVSTGDFFVPPPGRAAADVEVTGRMAVGESKTVAITAGKLGIIVFEGTAGQRVSLTASSSTFGIEADCGATVYIYHPDGTRLASTCVSWNGGGITDTPALSVSGTYAIVVQPSCNMWNCSFSGSMTLKLDSFMDVTGTITPGGPPVTVTTMTPGQQARLTFNGVAGQRVSLKINNVTISNSTVYIYNPNGTTLTWLSVFTNGAYMDTRTLPTAGTYTILVDPNSTYTGNMTLTLYEIIDVTGPITPGGPPVNMSITTPGQNARFTFSGTAGQKISLNIGSVTIATSYVYILKPDGTVLATVVDSETGTTSPVGTAGAYIDTQTLPVTGTYTVFVDPTGTNTGNMILTLYDASDVTGAITPGGPSVTVTIRSPGQSGRITFSGVAGQRMSLNMTGVTIWWSQVIVYNPDGTHLASTSVATYGGFLDTRTLPATGTYTILVNPTEKNTGNMTLSLYDVPADFAGTVTIGGLAVRATTMVPGQNANLTFDGTAGQQVTVRITNNTMSTVTVSLLKPDGLLLTSLSSSASSFNLTAQTLPVTGTYKVAIDPSGPNTGSIDVSVTSP